MTNPARQPHKANDPATLRCDNEPCLFHHLGICRFSCHAWQPCTTHTPAAPAEPKRDFVNTRENPWCYPGCMLVYEAKEQARKAEREKVLDEVIHDVERMIDAEQERTVDGEYTKDGITKLGILAYVSEHFKSLRGGEP